MAELPEPISAVEFRRYRGDADLAGMLAAYNASHQADGILVLETLEAFTSSYRHLDNCDPDTDLIVVELGGEIVGYARVTWWVESATGDRILLHAEFLRPEGRALGVLAALCDWGEHRLTEISVERPHDRPQHLTVYVDEGEAERLALLEGRGYRRTQTYVEMTRSLHEPIPEARLPAGLEIGPVGSMRAVWEADDRAFRDHVGHSDPTEESYRRWLEWPLADPGLWKVAFDGDAIAGQVLNYVNEEENALFGRRRGYTESISVQREWRGRGVARALIVESMRMFADMGMDEVSLGVHTDNPTGAFGLYTGLGYEIISTAYEMRRPLDQVVAD